MEIAHFEFNLKFRYPFTISRGTKTHQPIFVVALSHRGETGYGEAPAITYYHIPVEKMAADLEKNRQAIGRFAVTEPERFWHFLHHLIPDNPFLVCALDIAAWDLYGKMRKLPLYRCWGLEWKNTPVTDYTIGIDTVEKMREKMLARPWPVYKIKLGTDQDAEIIRALRKQTTATLRVDANSAWNVEQALELLPALAEAGVEFVEQPLDKSDRSGMKILFEKSSLPLIADESCVGEKDVAACAGLFHGINIKLTKCGGLTPTLRMIKEARSLGMKVMAGSMNESTVGSAAIAHLLPLLDYVDMDGPLLLEEDIATGLEFSKGVVSVSGKPGLGIEWLGGEVEQYPLRFTL